MAEEILPMRPGRKGIAMRIAVIGAGGIGGPLGASLATAGQDVTFLARGAHLAAMRANGLRVEGDRGETIVRPVQATDDPATIGPVDLVLFCVKLWDVESTGWTLHHPPLGSALPRRSQEKRRKIGNINSAASRGFPLASAPCVLSMSCLRVLSGRGACQAEQDDAGHHQSASADHQGDDRRGLAPAQRRHAADRAQETTLYPGGVLQPRISGP